MSSNVFSCRVQTVLAGLAGLAFVVSVAVLSSAASPARANESPLAGVWIDDTGRGAVEIKQCGSALCGSIVWLKSATADNGEPLTDKLNPRASQRNRSICGLQVIGDLQRQSDGSWDAGWIYDPKQGKAFDVAVEVASPQQLRVIGYMGTRLFSRTLIWTRAPANLGRCAPPSQASIRPVR